MREELNACQFYLKVDHLSIIGITPNRLKLYSCSFIPSVRAQIETVWRFHLENSIPNSAEAGLVSFMDAWYDLQDQELQEIQEETVEEMETSVPETSLCVQTFIEMEIKECVKAWSDLHDTLEEADEEVETSQPDLSVEETLHRGQEKFVVPVSFLIIPEEQRALLTADASAESEMPNSLAPPLEEPHPVSGDQTEAVQDGVELLSADVEPSALEHTQSDPNQESQSLLKEVHPIATRAQISTGITLSQMPKPTLFSPSRSAERPIIEFSLEQNKEVFPSLPSWLGHNTTLSNEHEAPTSREPPNLPISPKTKRRKVHSDGTPFFYTYQPKPRVAKALSLLQIPGHLLQWAVRYLGTSDGAETSTGAGS
ncbi:hypothetical protein DNTS_016072 [Danionella cerebrum]|nr:hypothetical protein DNTS_016072 [Danionella translucida]